ncbi:MAG: CBS domain-containing protein [Acetobacteraceae bacterium]
MPDAASIMTRAVVVINPDTTVAQAAKILAQNAISGAPVTDASGRLIGMISEEDLMRPFTATNEKRRAWWLQILAEGDDLAPEFVDYLRHDRKQVRDLMQADVLSAPPTASLAEIADIITRHHVKRVPIVDSGRLAGIVSRADLVRAMAEAPEAFGKVEV